MAIIGVMTGSIALAMHLTPSRTARAHSVAATETAVVPPVSTTPTGYSGSVSGSVQTTNAPETEVPDVRGKAVKVAETVLAAAGFTVQTRVADSASTTAAANTVVTQQPLAGARLAAGQAVVITYQASVAGGRQYVVVIDAGHQAKADLAPEPEGPGSKITKPKVAGGATGVATHIPEYVDALAISLKLQKVLAAQGVKVVMVRTGNNVDIPNSERARIGNRANADLVVRVHLNSASSSSARGILSIYPHSQWTGGIEVRSKAAAGLVEAAVTKATGAKAWPLSARGDMTGFNFSTRPTIIVECGFMSNPTDDRLGASPSYQAKLAQGIGAGVMSYLKSH